MRSSRRKKEKRIDLSIWVVQAILSGILLMAGIMKILMDTENLGQTIPWALQIPAFLVKLIGLLEVLVAVGIILPSLLRYRPEWARYAALTLVVMMVTAIVYHIVKAEYMAIPGNVIYGVLAAYVAWGRWKRAPISPKA
jgi:uncharacterized membrane protein YphA (DoxX/SURF4 family)